MCREKSRELALRVGFSPVPPVAGDWPRARRCVPVLRQGREHNHFDTAGTISRATRNPSTCCRSRTWNEPNEPQEGPSPTAWTRNVDKARKIPDLRVRPPRHRSTSRANLAGVRLGLHKITIAGHRQVPGRWVSVPDGSGAAVSAPGWRVGPRGLIVCCCERARSD